VEWRQGVPKVIVFFRLNIAPFGPFRYGVGSFLLSCVYAVVLTGCGFPVVNNHDVRRAKKSPLITYHALTTEVSHPFPRGTGNFMTPERIAATTKYPTTLDCLIKSEKEKDNPDLRLIDWKRVKTLEELDICLWRIFSSLDDFESIVEWMIFHKLEHNVQDPDRFITYDITDIKFLEDLATYKSYKKEPYVVTSFRWSKRVPYRGRSSPRIITGALWIRMIFSKENEKLNLVHTGWTTSM